MGSRSGPRLFKFHRKQCAEILESLTEETRAALRNEAAALRRFRDLRRAYLDHRMFGEPAWDILLALYAADDAIDPWLSVAEVASAAHVPETTCLRWLKYLEEEGLATMQRSALGGRGLRVSVADRASEAITVYLLNRRESGHVDN